MVSFPATVPDSNVQNVSLLFMVWLVDLARRDVEAPQDVTAIQKYRSHSQTWCPVRCCCNASVLTTSLAHNSDVFVVGDVSIDYVLP